MKTPARIGVAAAAAAAGYVAFDAMTSFYEWTPADAPSECRDPAYCQNLVGQAGASAIEICRAAHDARCKTYWEEGQKKKATYRALFAAAAAGLGYYLTR